MPTPPDRHVGRPWKETLLFFGKFLRHGTGISSITPTSRTLARAMLDGIDFDRASVIVELGAGTGAITEQIPAPFLMNFSKTARRRDQRIDDGTAEAGDQIVARGGFALRTAGPVLAGTDVAIVAVCESRSIGER